MSLYNNIILVVNLWLPGFLDNELSMCYIVMSHTTYIVCPSAPVQRLGELFRKLWNQRSFKAHVSPHEMLQVRADGGGDNVIIITRRCHLSARRDSWSLNKVSWLYLLLQRVNTSLISWTLVHTPYNTPNCIYIYTHTNNQQALK